MKMKTSIIQRLAAVIEERTSSEDIHRARDLHMLRSAVTRTATAAATTLTARTRHATNGTVKSTRPPTSGNARVGYGPPSHRPASSGQWRPHRVHRSPGDRGLRNETKTSSALSSPTSTPSEDAEGTKQVVLRSVKATCIAKVDTVSFFRETFRSKIRYTSSPYFRLVLVHDPKRIYEPNVPAPYLPMPPHSGTHKRRQLRLEAGRQLLEHGAVAKLRDSAPSSPAKDKRSKTDSIDSGADGDEAEDPGDFDSLGDLLSVPEGRDLRFPPIPNPEHEIELRAHFINGKKLTHRYAVVRDRCRRKIQTSLRVLFLSASTKARARLVSAEAKSAEELAPCIHPEYIYVFSPLSLSFSVKLSDLADDVSRALVSVHEQVQRPQSARRPSFRANRPRYY